MMKWFCEYSAVQKCFHVAPAGECMENNLEMLRTGETPSLRDAIDGLDAVNGWTVNSCGSE